MLSHVSQSPKRLLINLVRYVEMSLIRDVQNFIHSVVSAVQSFPISSNLNRL